LVLAPSDALAVLPIRLSREERSEAGHQIADRRPQIEDLPGGRDRELNAGALKRAEDLASFSKIFRTGKTVEVDDDHHVEQPCSCVLHQPSESGTLGEEALLRCPAIVYVGV
jgi:hypothetical protein